MGLIDTYTDPRPVPPVQPSARRERSERTKESSPNGVGEGTPLNRSSLWTRAGQWLRQKLAGLFRPLQTLGSLLSKWLRSILAAGGPAHPVGAPASQGAGAAGASSAPHRAAIQPQTAPIRARRWTWGSPLHRDTPRGRAAVAEGETSARRSSPTVFAPDGCDPATLWHQSAADLAAGLGALQDLTGQDATAAHFAMGLQLVVSQMKSAEPPFGTLGTSLAPPRAPVDALRPLLLQFVFPVLDNLHRGHQALEATADRTPGRMALQTLFTKVRGHFTRLLAGLGVSAIEPRGHRFDPREHEALAQTDDEGPEPGHISVVYQPGFRLDA